MTVPDFQTLMLPSLQVLSDGQVHSVGKTCDRVAEMLDVSQEDQKELLPSGKQARYRNRVNWALHYMKQAGVLVSPSRGHYQITDRGRELISSGLTRIDIKTLEEYPEFQEFRGRHTVSIATEGETSENEGTPQERLESASAELRKHLAEEVLDNLRKLDPVRFERVVLDVLVAMGYGGALSDSVSMTARTGDGGIDGVIKEDPLGLDVIVTQAKQWAGTVGEKEIRNFVGALESSRTRKGVFITTATFSSSARDYVKRIEKRVILIDGLELASLMIDHNVGVSVADTIFIRRIDVDYFEIEQDI